MSGWYKHSRNLFERPWAKDPKMVAVYEYLHCVAYVNDGMLHGHLIRRGSCPTTSSAIMEATGLSEQEVRTRIRKLLDCGEIIVKATNYGKIITVCDYDSYGANNDLFGLNSTTQQHPQQQTQEQPSNTPSNTPYIKEDRIYNNILRSHFIPSKQRESKELALEIMAIYNKVFDGVLRKWKRMSADMIMKVDNCVARYGRQSVDMVFDQIKHEKFSLGDNNTGFMADFSFIFKLQNYEAYLGRYELRQKQGNKKPQAEHKAVGVIDMPQQTVEDRRARRRNQLLDMVETANENPQSHCYMVLVSAYERGELAELNINWKPKAV